MKKFIVLAVLVMSVALVGSASAFYTDNYNYKYSNSSKLHSDNSFEIDFDSERLSSTVNARMSQSITDAQDRIDLKVGNINARTSNILIENNNTINNNFEFVKKK